MLYFTVYKNNFADYETQIWIFKYFDWVVNWCFLNYYNDVDKTKFGALYGVKKNGLLNCWISGKQMISRPPAYLFLGAPHFIGVRANMFSSFKFNVIPFQNNNER